MSAILRTIHGSYLYGLAGPGSDLDLYEVVEHGLPGQRVKNRIDTTTVTLDGFLRQVGDGVPQALEALWSPMKAVDPRWLPFLDGLRPDPVRAVPRFTGAILAYLSTHRKPGVVPFDEAPVKNRRHALRLALELDELLGRGSFDPVLTPSDRDLVTVSAELGEQDFHAELRRICPVELGL